VVDEHADGRAGIDAGLVKRLLAAQFPQWADLPVKPVKVDGWDNRTYRLGDELTARLPTHESYAAAVDKEHTFLPILAPALPVPIPEAVAKGEPGEGYPYHWAIRRWLDGETASYDTVTDLDAFAEAIAGFILALQKVDPNGGPAAGAHSFHRGAPPEYYDAETRRALEVLEGRIDTDAARDVWETALASRWEGAPVWFHGDIASGNLLVRNGKLSAVIDFGTSGVGDPACDLVIAWTFFTGRSRETFRAAVHQDPATWSRARGWALWKSLITLAADLDTNPTAADSDEKIITALLADHEAAR
jgi:aminoglycoside phosphotransferase (APT) family kinase protein